MTTYPTSWANPAATPGTKYVQPSGMTYDQSGRTYNATEQTGANKLYDGILASNRRADPAPATIWT